MNVLERLVEETLRSMNMVDTLTKGDPELSAIWADFSQVSYSGGRKACDVAPETMVLRTGLYRISYRNQAVQTR